MPSAPATIPQSGPDPELEALPEPRRPGRRLTLVTLVISGAASLAMAFGLRSEARYTMLGGEPLDVGALASFEPMSEHANRWVRAEGTLSSSVAVRYSRPLEPVSYRLAQVEGQPAIWVQITVPEQMEGPHFVPPSSFVGRLLPVSRAGLRWRGVREAMEQASGSSDVERAWVLIDNEAPTTTRWSIGVVTVFLGFAAFNAWGLFRLLRPVRDA